MAVSLGYRSRSRIRHAPQTDGLYRGAIPAGSSDRGTTVVPGRLDESRPLILNPKFLNAFRDMDMSFTAPLRDLNKLNTFVRVAQRRSFTKAAAELRTTPSVISKRIKELEEALGFTLLNRSTHGLTLTEAGEGLFQNCLEMLAKVDDYVTERRNIETGPFGTLRVLAGSDYAQHVLAPLATRFGKSRPGLRVHVSAVSSHAVAVEGGFDVIVSQQKPPVPGLVGLDLGTIRHVVCAAPAYLKKFGRPKTPLELREHNCLADQYGGPKSWPFQNSARPQHVEVKGSLSSDSNDVLIEMALKGC